MEAQGLLLFVTVVVLYNRLVLSSCDFDGSIDDDASGDGDHMMVIVMLGLAFLCLVTVITFVFLLLSATIAIYW